MTRKEYLAEWVIPISSKPIRNGHVIIENRRIISVRALSNRDRDAI